MIRRRRRRLKGRVYVLIAIIIVAFLYYSDISSFFIVIIDYSVNEDRVRSKVSHDHDSPISPIQKVVLKDEDGNPLIHRNSSSLQDYLRGSTRSTMSPASSIDSRRTEKARIDRGPILKILQDAGVILSSSSSSSSSLSSTSPSLSVEELFSLPTWKQVEDLYGPDPIIHGLDTCKKFRQLVPEKESRFVGVSGIFNSGTTAFGISLQANCRFRHHSRNMTNSVLSDSDGMLSQVPWAKHKMATEKDSHTIHKEIRKDHVLPVVLVRDPFFWMHSMCKEGYGVRWPHDSTIHCPNLVPNEFDRARFKALRNASSVSVWMGKNAKVGPSWSSLVHYYNMWYQSYVQADFPRLIIRFEDTLYHGEKVMKKVCECAGGESVSDRHLYFLDEAKWDHQQEQNNFVSSLITYGTDTGRYRNMTQDDLHFAKANLDQSLLDLFHYKK